MAISYRVTSANQIVLRDVVQGAQSIATYSIVTGSITPGVGAFVIAAETGVADDLDTINLTNLRAGDVVYGFPDSGDTITATSGVGNITTDTGSSIIADSTQIIRFQVNSAATGVIASLIRGGRGLDLSHNQVTAAQLADATHAVNTSGKRLGRDILETTNNRAYFALGSNATDKWRPFDDQGSTSDVTPA